MREGPRPCRAGEFREMMELLDLVFRVNRGLPPPMSADHPFVYHPCNVDRMHIVKEDRRVVSHILLWPITMTMAGVAFKVGGLGGVGTLPEYRGRGHSTELLKHCVGVMESEGYDFSVLWTGIPDFYRRVGWEQGGKTLSYVVPRDRAQALPELRGGTMEWNLSDSDWDELERIRQRLPVDTIRLPGWTKMLVGSRRCLIHMAKREGRLLGYTVNRGNEIIEFGGEPEVAAGMVRLRFDLFPSLTHINLQRVPPGRFASLLDGLGFARQEAPLGMVRLINPAQVLRKLGIAGVSVSQDGDKTTLKWDAVEVQLDQRQLVKLFFSADASLPPRPSGLPMFPFCWLLDGV